jgi:hypothetical protein
MNSKSYRLSERVGWAPGPALPPNALSRRSSEDAWQAALGGTTLEEGVVTSLPPPLQSAAPQLFSIA